MYVRRCPRTSASSLTPPREMRWNGRWSTFAIDRASVVLPTPGGPWKHRIGGRASGRSRRTARYSMIRSFTRSKP
eukprot:31315-Pelagococcus_subviridis.AAC.6